MVMINSTASDSYKSRSPPYLAFIISSIPDRFNKTFTNLHNATPGYFNIHQKYSVPQNDSRITPGREEKVASLLFTYVDLWNEIGARPESELRDNDWIFIFEDDVNVVPLQIIQGFYPELYAKWNHSNPNTSITGVISQGLQMAQQDGILYLGTCGAEYVDNITTMHYSYDGLFEIRRGFYYCTHAVAYTKWRARRMWSEMIAYGFFREETGSDSLARQWQMITRTYPISVASNILWPPEAQYRHFGFFFQDRGVLQPTK